MSETIEYQKLAPQAITGMREIGAYLQRGSIDARLRYLVELRASQINGCAYCVDLHARQARAEGETQQRLDCLPVWREAPFYTERERAALDWAETVTLISQAESMDDAREKARYYFSDQELVDLTFILSTINAWNRLAISFHAQPDARAD